MNIRIEKILEAVPSKMFFDKSFERNGFANQILKEIPIISNNLEHNNIFNCASILNREQEYHLFRKYNYIKYRIIKLTLGFEKSKIRPAPKPFRATKLERLRNNSLSNLENLIEKMNKLRNLLLKSNTRLVVKQVAKFAPEDSFKRDEFISNAYLHVLKAIDCFDYRRGFKFSTYCVNVLKTNLYRDQADLYRKQSVLENSENLKFIESPEADFSELNIKYNKQMIKLVFEELRKTSKRAEDKIFILKNYFGVDGSERLLLRDLAKQMGISKERVRQIKSQALESVRHLSYDPII